MVRRIPGGVGPYTDYLGRNRDFRDRRSSVPSNPTFTYISTGDWVSGAVNPTSDVSLTANRPFLAPILASPFDRTLSRARIQVQDGSAGTFTAGIYRWVNGEELRQLSGSEVSFDTSAAGFVEADCPRPVTLFAGETYFFVFASSSASVEYAGFRNGALQVPRVGVVDNGVQRRYLRPEFAPSVSQEVPSLIYLSTEAAKIV